MGRAGDEVVDVEAEILGETDKAWRLNDGGTIQWVPKSQVTRDRDNPKIFVMPTWLAKDKGFV